MLTRTKKHIQIPCEEWEELKKNPALGEALELLEDITDIEKAKKVTGKSLTIDQYLKKRDIRNKNKTVSSKRS